MTAMIVHRDARCAVVDKPSGLATHRGWDGGDDALLQRVRDAVGRYVYPIHRLDRGASGLVVFALDGDAARALSLAWPEADKRYLAITRGHPPEHVVIDHPVPNASNERVPAITELWRKETFGRYALIEARPRTGRLHQIRRHCKHIACPLIGDVRYGKGEHNRMFRERFGLHRLALHALELAFAHPAAHLEAHLEDNGPVRIVAPVPEDLAGPLRAMGLSPNRLDSAP